uniref:DUF4033 domain-containing protein n=1 Tax=Steinernema glaseri TaxID=37863 RepID=A0A1I7Y1S4_9BILA
MGRVCTVPSFFQESTNFLVLSEEELNYIADKRWPLNPDAHFLPLLRQIFVTAPLLRELCEELRLVARIGNTSYLKRKQTNTRNGVDAGAFQRKPPIGFCETHDQLAVLCCINLQGVKTLCRWDNALPCVLLGQTGAKADYTRTGDAPENAAEACKLGCGSFDTVVTCITMELTRL